MSGIHLLAAAPGPARRQARFGGDDTPDEGGLRAAEALRGAVPRTTTWLCAPTTAARRTARALGADPTDDPALTGPDYGTWTGRALDEIDPGDWLTDPHSAPHGGETLAALVTRTGTWLDRHTGDTLTAVTDPVVIRAALTHALNLGPHAVWQLDVAPLSLTRLTHRAGRWHLHLSPLRP